MNDFRHTWQGLCEIVLSCLPFHSPIAVRKEIITQDPTRVLKSPNVIISAKYWKRNIVCSLTCSFLFTEFHLNLFQVLDISGEHQTGLMWPWQNKKKLMKRQVMIEIRDPLATGSQQLRCQISVCGSMTHDTRERRKRVNCAMFNALHSLCNTKTMISAKAHRYCVGWGRHVE